MNGRRRVRPARIAGMVYLVAVVVSLGAATLLVAGGIPTRVLLAVV